MKKLNRILLAAIVAFSAVGVGVANASVIVMNFAGLNGDSGEAALDYYNGGTGSLGSGPGTNYGVSFGSDAIVCSGKPGGVCNTAQIPGGAGANSLSFLSGTGDMMDVASGFDTGFSFYYSAAYYPGTVTVWSGLDGTGTQLASIELPVTGDGASNPDCYSTDFCPYSPIGVTFSGIAKSANFSGTADQIGFADITLGSETAGNGSANVPEPAPIFLFGLGLLVIQIKRWRPSA